MADLGSGQLVSMKELQRTLSVSRATVYRLVQRGTLAPPRRLPGAARIVWRAADVQAFLDRVNAD